MAVVTDADYVDRWNVDRPGHAFLYQLAVVTMFQNSALYLKESIAYHMLVGVEHFYLCDNASTDDYLALLQPYIDAGIVELSMSSRKAANMDDWMGNMYAPFDDETIARSRGVVHWLACLDSDEFMVPAKESSLSCIFNQPKFKEHGGISLNWVSYGSNGIQRLSANDLMLNRMNRRAKIDVPLNHHLKVVVQPHFTERWNGHMAVYMNGHSATTPACDEDTTTTPFSKRVCVEEVRINHYYIGDMYHWTKNKEPYLRNIWGVGGIASARKAVIATESNDVEDNIMQKWVTDLRHMVFSRDPLLALAGVLANSEPSVKTFHIVCSKSPPVRQRTADGAVLVVAQALPKRPQAAQVLYTIGDLLHVSNVVIDDTTNYTWTIQRSSLLGSWIQRVGAAGDVLVPAEYSGAGRTEIALWRPSTGIWHVCHANDQTKTQQWGQSGDIPVPGDYDGDGKVDFAVYRPSEGNWYILNSSGGTTVKQWGAPGDIPAIVDVDGDERTDFVVYRPSDNQWYICRSSDGGTSVRGAHTV